VWRITVALYHPSLWSKSWTWVLLLCGIKQRGGEGSALHTLERAGSEFCKVLFNTSQQVPHDIDVGISSVALKISCVSSPIVQMFHLMILDLIEAVETRLVVHVARLQRVFALPPSFAISKLNNQYNPIIVYYKRPTYLYPRAHYESGHDIHFYTGVERNLAHEGSRDSEPRFCVEITEGVLGPFRTLASCLFSAQKNSRWAPCGRNIIILTAPEKRSHDCCCCRRSSWTLPLIVWDELCEMRYCSLSALSSMMSITPRLTTSEMKKQS